MTACISAFGHEAVLPHYDLVSSFCGGCKELTKQSRLHADKIDNF